MNAERYDAWYDSPLGAFCFAKEVDLVRRAMGDLADRSVLEVGCGTGRFLLSLGKNASKSAGVDRDQAMLDIARRHTPPTATSFRWIQADAVSLPFPDGTFDVVFESTLLCFQSDPARVIREMVRVCLSGGTIVLGELNPFSPWQLWRHAKGWLGDSTWHEARWNSSRALMRILSENSYRQSWRDVRCFSFLWFRTDGFWKQWSNSADISAPGLAPTTLSRLPSSAISSHLWDTS